MNLRNQKSLEIAIAIELAKLEGCIINESQFPAIADPPPQIAKYLISAKIAIEMVSSAIVAEITEQCPWIEGSSDRELQ